MYNCLSSSSVFVVLIESSIALNSLRSTSSSNAPSSHPIILRVILLRCTPSFTYAESNETDPSGIKPRGRVQRERGDGETLELLATRNGDEESSDELLLIGVCSTGTVFCFLLRIIMSAVVSRWIGYLRREELFRAFAYRLVCVKWWKLASYLVKPLTKCLLWNYQNFTSRPPTRTRQMTIIVVFS